MSEHVAAWEAGCRPERVHSEARGSACLSQRTKFGGSGLLARSSKERNKHKVLKGRAQGVSTRMTGRPARDCASPGQCDGEVVAGSGSVGLWHLTPPPPQTPTALGALGARVGPVFSGVSPLVSQPCPSSVPPSLPAPAPAGPHHCPRPPAPCSGGPLGKGTRVWQPPQPAPYKAGPAPGPPPGPAPPPVKKDRWPGLGQSGGVVMLLRLLLAWAAVVPSLGQVPGASEPRASCGPGSCYALFPRRHTFLEAWRACRKLGGDLATPRTPEEARRVDSLVGAGPAGRLLWIGLQRQPRQCQPQRPLRGFTWTTGDQDTAFTNWASPATGGPCPVQRCAALESSGEHRWLEGSCTLAVDGYLCQFGFEGACPALPEEAGQSGPAVYTTPFHLVSTELEWLPFGSVAAVQCQEGRGASLLCMKQPEGGVGWSRAGPVCPGTGCGRDNGGCEHECVEEVDGRVSCRCSEGFQLAMDGRSCEDPCAQALCEQQCEPGGPQGYSCHCRLGFRPAEDEPHRCVDTDECQIAGVCQQMCVNYVGGFECYCNEGHELEADGISCSPAGAMGAMASQDFEDELLDDKEGEDEEEVWESFDGSWTEMPGMPWMEPTQMTDFGLLYGPSFPEVQEPQTPYPGPTWPPPLSAPQGPYHSAVLSVTRPVVVSATRPTLHSAHQPPIIPATPPALLPDHRLPRIPASYPNLPPAQQPPVVSATHSAQPPAHLSPTNSDIHLAQPPVHRSPIISATRPARPSAHQPPTISATHSAQPPAHQPPIISATHPAWLPTHQPPTISATHPAQPPAHQPPVISAKHPELFPAHQSPVAQDIQATGTQITAHLPRIPANHVPLVTTPSAHQPPQVPGVLVLRAHTSQLPITPSAQPPLTITHRSPVPHAHQVPAPAATQPLALPTLLPPQSPINQTSPSSLTYPHSKAPQVPREGTPAHRLASWLPSVAPTAAPTALGEASLAGHSPRDDRWLLVALLVPTCVFLVVLLALGIVYCTRCGPHAPNKRVTDCYHWVTHTGSKSSMEPVPPRGSLTGVQTCRTSV